MAKAIQFGKPKDPCKVDANFPRKLQQLLAKMLKKNPVTRYNSATEIVTEIDEYLLAATDDARSMFQRLMGRFGVADWC